MTEVDQTSVQTEVEQTSVQTEIASAKNEEPLDTEEAAVAAATEKSESTRITEEPIEMQKKEEDETEEAQKGEEKTEEKASAKNEEPLDTEEAAVAAATEKAKERNDTAKKQKVVSDASLLPESNDPEEMRKQVEFYFSDSNLRFDKFLYRLVGKENKYVPLKLIASFKRMQRFKCFPSIVTALENSEILELNSKKTMVRRKVPLLVNDPQKIREVKDQAQSRSIYAKGFGEETNTSQFDIEEFFKPYGPINAVRLRRTEDKVFKTSVFVEFKDDDTMEKFMSIEEKPKFQDKELLYMRKKEYVDMKIQDIRDGKIVPGDQRKKFDVWSTGHNSRGGARFSRQNKKQQNGDDEAGENGDKEDGDRENGDKEDGDRENGDRENGDRNSHRSRGHRPKRGRGSHRGGRGGRRGGRDNKGAYKERAAADDQHTIPKVQATNPPTAAEKVVGGVAANNGGKVEASTEQGVKRQREGDGEAAESSGGKKMRVEAADV